MDCCVASADLPQDKDLIRYMKLIDVVCPKGHIAFDVWVKTLEPQDCPACNALVTRTQRCGAQTKRIFLSAPSITPNGTQPERNTGRPKGPAPVDTQKVAAEVKFEVEQKWQRYSDPTIAEHHVGREINEAAGIADHRGNEKPIPKPDPITFRKPTPAECAG